MAKPNLKATTPHGTFERQTFTAYTYIVVWASARAAAALGNGGSGVAARWVKDFGFGVTWHGSLASAQRAAKSYKWDSTANLIGVFPVDEVRS
jgi:hypothetical protein